MTIVGSLLEVPFVKHIYSLSRGRFVWSCLVCRLPTRECGAEIWRYVCSPHGLTVQHLIEKNSIDDLVIDPKGGGRGSVPERLGPGFEEQKEQKQGGSSCLKLFSECNTRLFI